MTRRDSKRHRRDGFAALWLLMVLLLAACTAAGSDGQALQRGDEAFARGDYTEALAEYRLALRRDGEDARVLTRAAHAYAQVGRVEEARDHYRQAIAVDSSVADLAAADLLRVARTATERRRDGFLAAAAVEAALELRPGVNLPGLARPLAEHFAGQGQFGRALPYFQKAIGEGIEDPLLVLEMARAYEELGDCELALIHLDEIRDDVPAGRRSEVEWRVGNCSFEMGRLALQEERLEDALEFFQATIDVGEPRSRVAEAWFESGEILVSLGRCSEAIEAFRRAQAAALPGGFLIERARDRIDDLRFGPPGDGEPC
ncbi:MAG: tetratricopeptide repeat protein [Gemmatimonadota bacterium]